jgi:hypothetical protein
MQPGTQGMNNGQGQSGELKEGLKSEARELAGSAQAAARSAAESGKEKLVQSAEGVAQALEHASERLRDDDQSEIAAYTQTIAQKIEQVADALKSRDLPSLAQDVRQLAQRQPALFLGGAFTAGIIAARFLKSSAGGSGENSGRAGGMGRGQ